MRVAVVGGGVAGLTAAYRLMQAGHEVRPLRGGAVARRPRPHLRRLRRAPRVLLPPPVHDRHDDRRPDRGARPRRSARLEGLEGRLLPRRPHLGLRHAARPPPLPAPAPHRPRPPRPRRPLPAPSGRLAPLRGGHGLGMAAPQRRPQRPRGRLGAALRGKFADQAEEVAMAWLWSKIHLRFASRGAGPQQKEKLGYMMGSFGVYVSETRATHPRRRRPRRDGAARRKDRRQGWPRRRPPPRRRPRLARRRRHRLRPLGALLTYRAASRRRV